jgi:hypothetical protein
LLTRLFSRNEREKIPVGRDLGPIGISEKGDFLEAESRPSRRGLEKDQVSGEGRGQAGNSEEGNFEESWPGPTEVAECLPGSLPFLEFFLKPTVHFFFIGKDAGLWRAIEPVDGQAEFMLPTLAGLGGSVQVFGDLFPGFEDSGISHSPFLLLRITAS